MKEKNGSESEGDGDATFQLTGVESDEDSDEGSGESEDDARAGTRRRVTKKKSKFGREDVMAARLQANAPAVAKRKSTSDLQEAA